MKYTNDFEILWKIYPKRAGGNPKPRAYKAFQARLKEKVLYSDLQAGVLRYYNYCKGMAQIGSPYVMQTATFFSANTESWDEPWELPKPEEPKQDKSGFPQSFDPSRQCSSGESMEACKIRAWREYERRTAG